MTRRRRFDPARIGLYVLLVLFALIFLIPVYVLVSSSLKSFAEVQDLSRLWSPPSGIHLESFSSAWSGIPEKGLRGLSQNLLNSIYLTVPATLTENVQTESAARLQLKWQLGSMSYQQQLAALNPRPESPLGPVQAKSAGPAGKFFASAASV